MIARFERLISSLMPADWIAILLIVGTIVYLPALWGVFTFDDFPWILQNTRLDPLDLLLRRPLTVATFAFNLRVTGPSPVGFHLVNIALHLANSALVYWIIVRSLGRTQKAAAIAAVGAAVFLLHPAQTGAVTYVSGRSTSLMTFWLLVAHVAAIRSLDGHGVRRMAASIGAFVLAVASKETALIYPAIWIAWLVFGTGLERRRGVRFALPHLVAASIVIAGMMWHPGYRTLLREGFSAGHLAATSAGQVEQRFGLGFCFNDDAPRTDSCTARRVEGVAGLTRFLVSPWTITVDPGRHAADVTDLIVVALAGLAAWAALRMRPGGLAAGAAWCVAALLPTNLLVVRSDPVSDRLLYLPMVGIALVVAAIASRTMPGVVRRAATIGVCVILVGLAAMTWRRNVTYQSEIALWQDAVAGNPDNPRALINLGSAFASAGRFDEARAQYRDALRRWPDLKDAEQALRKIELQSKDGLWR